MNNFPTYKEPLYRPPAEANSLILQVAYGCPNNTCTFCGMYKGRKYSERNIDELFSEIDALKNSYSSVKRIFLADGDVMFLEYNKLLKILEKLCNSFPNLSRINMYSNAKSILSKSHQELAELKKRKLAILYLGLESGSNKVLSNLHKYDLAEDAINASSRLKECGIKLSVMLLLGCGGKELSNLHVEKSIEVLNKMQPPILSILNMIPTPGTQIYKDVEKGVFQTLTIKEILDELKAVVSGLNLNRTVFRCNHASNPLPLEGRFPKDKEKLILEIDRLINYL